MRRVEQQVATIAANAADLLAFFERRVPEDGDAADLLSECLTVAWRRIDDLPGADVEARMWLFGVARNVLANARRASVRRWKLVERIRGQLVPPGSNGDGDRVVEVRDAVRRLPSDLRDLIGLVHWEGFSLAEAAAIIGIPASTARGRYQSARRMLRQALSDAVTGDSDAAAGASDSVDGEEVIPTP